ALPWRGDCQPATRRRLHSMETRIAKGPEVKPDHRCGVCFEPTETPKFFIRRIDGRIRASAPLCPDCFSLFDQWQRVQKALGDSPTIQRMKREIASQ
ncbi:MAG: hypothetical protein ACR2RE_31680, partial [Geminicoccaceae bacterium]